MKKVINTHTKECALTLLNVTVGTTGHRGVASSHSGRTLFRLTNEGCANWSISVDETEVPNPKELEIVFRGDWELDDFLESLIFAAKALKAQTEAEAIHGSIEGVRRLSIV